MLAADGKGGDVAQTCSIKMDPLAAPDLFQKGLTGGQVDAQLLLDLAESYGPLNALEMRGDRPGASPCAHERMQGGWEQRRRLSP